MIEIVPSIMVQGHSAASTMKDTFNVPMAVSVSYTHLTLPTNREV